VVAVLLVVVRPAFLNRKREKIFELRCLQVTCFGLAAQDTISSGSRDFSFWHYIRACPASFLMDTKLLFPRGWVPWDFKWTLYLVSVPRCRTYEASSPCPIDAFMPLLSSTKTYIVKWPHIRISQLANWCCLSGLWFIYTGGHDHGKPEGHMFSRANATLLLEPHNHDHNEWQHSEHTAKMSSRKKVSVACTWNLNCRLM
jgi:hypothetical protein